jgi:hypothetical protein
MFTLIAHLLVTLAKLARPGGIGAVAAESLALKHQLLIMKRAQRRAPNLTSWDRLVLGVCALFVSPRRLSKMAVIVKPSTLLCFHHALVKGKYHLLYSPRKRCRPGPKGPSKELIGAVIEMKRRNPRFGCRKIAEQISSAFGIEINKDVVQRILIRHYRPVPGGDGPSWLTLIGHAKDSLWSAERFVAPGYQSLPSAKFKRIMGQLSTADSQELSASKNATINCNTAEGGENCL